VRSSNPRQRFAANPMVDAKSQRQAGTSAGF